MAKFTAVYVRVSTEGQNIENQLPDLKRWAQANDIDVPPDDNWVSSLIPWQGKSAIWIPDKFTGRSTNRPGWKKLIEKFDAGHIDRVVCWRIDRLGRRATGLNHFFERCVELGCNLISLRDGIDLSTPAGRMVAGVLASIAQFECETMKERLRAKINVDREKSVTAHEMNEQGADTEAIARKILTSTEEVLKILSKPRGVLWYGGRKAGQGRKQSCSTDRVTVLLRNGLTMQEVAAATGASKRTVYRRLKEIQTESAAAAYSP